MATVNSTTSTGDASLRQFVQQLMARDRAPRDRLAAQRADLQSELKLFQDLGTQLSSLLNLSRSFSASDRTNPLRRMTVTGNDAAVVDLTAEGNAPTGSFTVEVLQLASRQTLASDAVPDAEKAIGSGDGRKADAGSSDKESTARFRFQVGGASFEIEADISSASTKGQVLSKLAQAINSSGAGVRAVVMDVGGGSKRLVLRTELSGVTGALTEIRDLKGTWMSDLGLRLSPGKNGSSGPVVGGGAEAVVLIDGVRVTATDNVIKNVIPGLTLTLKGVGKQVVTVARDEDAVVKQVQDFITQFNKTVDQVRGQTQAADRSGQGRGLLAGDIAFARLRTALRDAANRSLATGGEGPKRLSDIGVTTDREGHLSLGDAKALRAAIEGNPEQVDAVWRQAGSKLTTLLNGYSRVGGILSQSQRSVQDQILHIDDRISDQDQALSRREDALMNQMASLQTSIGALNQQRQYLSSLLSSGDLAASGLG